MIDDANARWVLRLPTNWNGRLVVGVPGGLRSEFMGDFIFSDLVVQLGYAYVSTNKGMLNFFFTAPSADPAACRLSPRSAVTGTLFTHLRRRPRRHDPRMVRADAPGRRRRRAEPRGAL